jgi:RHS repeat-associated protein
MLLADLSNPAQRTTRYYHTDDLYNVMAVTDDAGNVVERYEYDDYGTPTFMNANGDVLAQPPGNREPSWIANPYLFTGRRFDPETAWYHYRTRYLDPAAGRFTTRDIIGIWGDPWEFGNGYSYVGNNSLSWPDPLGLGRCDDGREDPDNSDQILTDPNDPCHKRCIQRAKGCIDRNWNAPRCSRDRNRCVRACNRAKRILKNNHAMDQYGPGIADQFWFHEGETRIHHGLAPLYNPDDERVRDRDIRDAIWWMHFYEYRYQAAKHTNTVLGIAGPVISIWAPAGLARDILSALFTALTVANDNYHMNLD